jgi:hypothetical protein
MPCHCMLSQGILYFGGVSTVFIYILAWSPYMCVGRLVCIYIYILVTDARPARLENIYDLNDNDSIFLRY